MIDPLVAGLIGSILMLVFLFMMKLLKTQNFLKNLKQQL